MFTDKITDNYFGRPRNPKTFYRDISISIGSGGDDNAPAGHQDSEGMYSLSVALEPQFSSIERRPDDEEIRWSRNDIMALIKFAHQSFKSLGYEVMPMEAGDYDHNLRRNEDPDDLRDAILSSDPGQGQLVDVFSTIAAPSGKKKDDVYKDFETVVDAFCAHIDEVQQEKDARIIRATVKQLQKLGELEKLSPTAAKELQLNVLAVLKNAGPESGTHQHGAG